MQGTVAALSKARWSDRISAIARIGIRGYDESRCSTHQIRTDTPSSPNLRSQNVCAIVVPWCVPTAFAPTLLTLQPTPSTPGVVGCALMPWPAAGESTVWPTPAGRRTASREIRGSPA